LPEGDRAGGIERVSHDRISRTTIVPAIAEWDERPTLEVSRLPWPAV
jgi:hypothetical protein